MKETESTQSVVQRIKAFLDNQGWEYQLDAKDNVFHGVKVSLIKFAPAISSMIIVRENFYCIYAYLPLKITPKMKLEISELINRINDFMVNGNFEITMRIRRVRYKVYVYCNSDFPVDNVIQNSIELPTAMIMKYFKYFVSVNSGKYTPLQAVRQIDKDRKRLQKALEGMKEEVPISEADPD